MFRIDALIDAARREPSLAAQPRLAPALASASAISATEDRSQILREWFPSAGSSAGSSAASDDERPVGSAERPRRFGPVASLILHLLPLLLLLDFPMRPPAAVTPIPVQLVFQPPPLPKPMPKPKPETQRPRGRIASVEMGATQAKGRDQEKREEHTRNKEPSAPPRPQLEATQETAYFPPPPPLPAPAKLDLPKPPAPKPAATPKPPPKRYFAAREPYRRLPAPAFLSPRSARYPGPAATRDEYLAYLAYLARQHLGLLSHGLIGDRRGETIINVLVLDDGTVAMLSVGLSSGYPDIDERIEEMIRAVGRFPPLPQWFQGPAMRLEFRLRFPEALEG